jgi:hypothetical protein
MSFTSPIVTRHPVPLGTGSSCSARGRGRPAASQVLAASTVASAAFLRSTMTLPTSRSPASSHPTAAMRCGMI